MAGESKSKRKTPDRMAGQCQIVDWNESFRTVEQDMRLKAAEGSCVTHPTGEPVMDR